MPAACLSWAVLQLPTVCQVSVHCCPYMLICLARRVNEQPQPHGWPSGGCSRRRTDASADSTQRSSAEQTAAAAVTGLVLVALTSLLAGPGRAGTLSAEMSLGSAACRVPCCVQQPCASLTAVVQHSKLPLT